MTHISCFARHDLLAVQPQCDVDPASLEELREELKEALAGYSLSRRVKTVVVFDAMGNRNSRLDQRCAPAALGHVVR